METVEADFMQTAVSDAVVEEDGLAIAMAIGNTTEAGREEGGAMAIGDALFEEAGARAMQIGDFAGMPINGATVAQKPINGASIMQILLESAAAMPVDGDMKLPSNSSTATPTTGATAMIPDGGTAMPVDGDMEFPSNISTATPASGATAMFPDGATAMPVDGDMELPSNSSTATPTTGATAMFPDGATAMPVDGDMELPSNSSTATPTTGATAMFPYGATAMPVDGDMELPSNRTTETLTTGAMAMMFSIGMDCEPSATDVDLCKVCGQRHLLDENHEYNYQDEVDDELTCHICLQPLISPLDTPCGHTYCQECLTNFLVESDFCPVDRVPILLQNCRKSNVLVHKLLDKLIVFCPFREHCSETMPRGELQGHLLSSAYGWQG